MTPGKAVQIVDLCANNFVALLNNGVTFMGLQNLVGTCCKVT